MPKEDSHLVEKSKVHHRANHQKQKSIYLWPLHPGPLHPALFTIHCLHICLSLLRYNTLTHKLCKAGLLLTYRQQETDRSLESFGSLSPKVQESCPGRKNSYLCLLHFVPQLRDSEWQPTLGYIFQRPRNSLSEALKKYILLLGERRSKPGWLQGVTP